VTFPNHIIGEHLLDESGLRTLNLYATNDGYVDMTKGALLATATSSDNYGDAMVQGISADDDLLSIVQCDWASDSAGSLWVRELASSTLAMNEVNKGIAFIGEFAETVISTGAATQATDFLQPNLDIPIVKLLVRGGATAYHGDGQVFVVVSIKAKPSPVISIRVANAVLDAISSTITSLDTDKVLGSISGNPSEPGVWVKSDTDSPLKVAVAGGMAHIGNPMVPCVVDVMALVNLSIDLDEQDSLIIPCGTPDSPLSDLASAGITIDPKVFRIALAKELLSALQPLHTTLGQ